MPNFFDQHIQNIQDWEIGTYENCEFSGLDFKQTPIKGAKFIECRFKDCDLSNISVSRCSFQAVAFEKCKLQGVQFEAANPFGYECMFKSCLLRHATFYQVNLQQSSFEDCDLTEVDFTEIKAQGTPFINCELVGAIFENADLRKANFDQSVNLLLDPEQNQVKGLQINNALLTGLLTKYQLTIKG